MGPVEQTFSDALAYLRAYGWHQGSAFAQPYDWLNPYAPLIPCEGEPAACALAALHGAAEHLADPSAFRHLLCTCRGRLDAVIEAEYGPLEERQAGVIDPIAVWNDTPGRTFTEVERMLEKAAAKAAEEGV